MSRERLLAFLVLAVAAALRTYGLASWPIDGDELYSWYDVEQLLASDGLAAGSTLFPLGYLLMAAPVPLLGQTELALRLLPVLLSWGAVAVLLFARADVLRPSLRLIAGLLAALAPWLLFHGQAARFYGPLIFFGAIALSCALPGPRRRPRSAWIALLLAVLCHPTAALLAPALVLGEGSRAQIMRRLAWCSLPVLAAAFVFLFTEGTALHRVVSWSFGGADPGHYGVKAFLLGLGYNVGPEVGLMALIGLIACWRRGAPEARLLGLAAALPALLLVLAGLAGISVYQRYLMVALPAVLLLAGIGWTRLPAGLPRAAALGLLLLAPLPRLVGHLADGSRHDTRAVAEFLAARADPEDHLLIEEHAAVELYLYDLPGFADIETIEAPIGPPKQHSLARSWRDAWVALKASRMTRPQDKEFMAWINEVFREVGRIGREPSWLERHDNRYVIFRRIRRLKPGPYVPPTNTPKTSSATPATESGK